VGDQNKGGETTLPMRAQRTRPEARAFRFAPATPEKKQEEKSRGGKKSGTPVDEWDKEIGRNGVGKADDLGPAKRIPQKKRPFSEGGTNAKKLGTKISNNRGKSQSFMEIRPHT